MTLQELEIKKTEINEALSEFPTLKQILIKICEIIIWILS